MGSSSAIIDHPYVPEFRVRSTLGLDNEERRESMEEGADHAGWSNKGTGKFPRIPGYEIIGELGRGGMGVIYKARQLRLDRLVAIKVVGKGGNEPLDSLRRFKRETQAAARLSHPHIVSVYDAGLAGATYYLAMEFIDGIDLNRLVELHGPLPVDRACDYIRQAALGLQHAFEQGLVHRDIKPANLIVTEPPGGGCDVLAPRFTKDRIQGYLPSARSLVKILDMGLARFGRAEDFESSASMLTQNGTIMGTPDFIAPEQVENSHTVDIRADLYSLGCTFYYLLAGQVPFPGRTSLEKLDKHRWGRPRRLEWLRRDVGPRVAAVVNKLMAKRPEERYQTPAELVEALAAARSGAAAAEALEQPQADREKSAAEPSMPAGPLKPDIEEEFDGLQLSLTDLLERNAFAEAGQVVQAMIRLKPDDSLTLSVRAFLDYQQASLEPAGECRCFQGHKEGVRSVAFSRDGTRSASGDGAGMIRVWDANSGRRLRSLAGHEDALTSVVFTVDGGHLLSASKDQTIRLWHIDSGREVRTYRGHAGAVQSIALSLAGNCFLSAGDDRVLRLWDLESGRRLRRLTGHTGDIKSVVFATDGRSALSGSWDHTARLWNLESGCECQRFDGAMNFFNGVALAPDGRSILCGGLDNAVYWYEMGTAGCQRRFEGHGDWVTSVAFSPDGRHALSGSHDHTLCLWDVDKGCALYRCAGHGHWVTSVAFSPDGRHALSGSMDGTMRLWRLPA